MHIAVFGGLGFAGFALGNYLKNKYPDYRIELYDNLSRRGAELNSFLSRDRNLKFTHCDIRCWSDIQSLQCDFIIDASADASVQSGLNDTARKVIDTNLTGSLNLIHLAEKQDANFIFLSTNRVYSIEKLNSIRFEIDGAGFRPSANQDIEGLSSKGISESFSIDGYKSIYGATKYCVEQLLIEYVQFKNLKVVINRFGVLAGPGQFGKIDQGILMFWLLNHYWKRPLSYIGYHGKGYQVRDFLHVRDFCEVIDLQLHDIQRYNGQIYNIGGGLKNSASLLQLSELAQICTGNKMEIAEVAEGRRADIPWYATDYSKFHNTSGWKPKRGLDQIFQESFEWLKDNDQILKKLI